MTKRNNPDLLVEEQAWMLAFISCLDDGEIAIRASCEYKFYPSIKLAFRDSATRDHHTDFILRTMNWQITDHKYH